MLVHAFGLPHRMRWLIPSYALKKDWIICASMCVCRWLGVAHHPEGAMGFAGLHLCGRDIPIGWWRFYNALPISDGFCRLSVSAAHHSTLIGRKWCGLTFSKPVLIKLLVLVFIFVWTLFTSKVEATCSQCVRVHLNANIYPHHSSCLFFYSLVNYAVI